MRPSPRRSLVGGIDLFSSPCIASAIMAPLDQNRGQPLWLRLPTVIAVVAVLTLGKIWLAGKTGLSFDESYYTLWSLHLSPGYLDHPPVVALLIALGRLIGGDGELGVRLPAIFCVVIT